MFRDRNRTRSPGSCRVFTPILFVFVIHIPILHTAFNTITQRTFFFLFISHKETERCPAKQFCCLLHCQLNTRTQFTQGSCYRSIHQHQWRAWKEPSTLPTLMGTHAVYLFICFICFVLPLYFSIATLCSAQRPTMGGGTWLCYISFKNSPRALDPACKQPSVTCRLR